MFRPPTTREMLAQSCAAQAIEERLEVLAVIPTMADPAFRRQQAESIVLAVLAIYRGALADRVVVTGLHREDKVIGQIGVR